MTNRKKMIPLPANWHPGKFDVICARGRLAVDHEGNRLFRKTVQQYLNDYSISACKFHKSRIVSHIVDSVRKASPEGGFVKLVNDRWHEVGDRYAREKVGQTFRDLLHTQYRSSTKAKARARVSRHHTAIEDSSSSLAFVQTEPQAFQTMYQCMKRESGMSIVSNASSNYGESCSAPAPQYSTSQIGKQSVQQWQQQIQPLLLPKICFDKQNSNQQYNIVPAVTKDECYYDFLQQLDRFLDQEEHPQHHHPTKPSSTETAPILDAADLEPIPLGDAVTFHCAV